MIMYLKSSLSLSLINGCNIGCQYCILSVLENRNKLVVENKSYKKAVNELLNNHYYTKKVPLSINNISDPFATDIAFQNTVGILLELQNQKVENPIIIITKGYVTADKIQRLAQIQLRNLFIFYSFAGLPGTLEPLDKNKQIETIKALSQLNNIKLIHYWRPIIQDINTSDIIISEIAELSQKYFVGAVISGLRMNSFIRERFQEKNLPISINYDANHKIIINETVEKVKKHLLMLGEKNFFFKTSCAISFFMQSEDYNGYMHKKDFCDKNCMNYHICHLHMELPSKESINLILKQINRDENYYINHHSIHLEGTFSQEELTYIRHSLHFPITADKILKSNNNELLSQ